MKKYSHYIFLILILSGCGDDENHTQNNSHCEVTFTNVDSATNLSMVIYSVPNFESFEPSKNSNGITLFRIPGMKNGMVSVQKPGVSSNVFVTDGDTLRINNLKDGEDNFFEFEGDNAPHYNFLRECEQFISKYQKFSGDIALYKKYCKRRFKERKDFLKNYALINKVSMEFLAYTKNMFKYEYFYELTIPLHSFTIDQLKAVDKNYFEDFQIEDLNDNSILKSSTSALALDNYLGYYVTQSYKGYEGGDEFKKHYEEITRGFDGRVREYAYTALMNNYSKNLFPDNINLLINYIEKTIKLVKDTSFSKKLNNLDKNLLPLNKPLPDSIKNIRLMGLDDKTMSLGTILENYKASNIVIDNWASWCWACFMDMEEAKEFKEQIVEDGIKWIYISIDKKKDIGKWKQKSREKQNLGLMVNQYLITDDDLKMYNDFFGTIEGIPRYLFFNTKGELILSNGPRPTDSVVFRKALNQLK